MYILRPSDMHVEGPKKLRQTLLIVTVMVHALDVGCWY